jgi:DNA-directed RNA polymerase subunit M/transcription elongation factor TFIIS
MKFCEKCNNKLYVRVNGIEVKYYCYLCQIESSDPVTIINHKKYTSENKIDKLIHNMLYDITYPIINTKCSTPECSSTKLVYFKMEDMKNLYLCRECKKWRIGGGSIPLKNN